MIIENRNIINTKFISSKLIDLKVEKRWLDNGKTLEYGLKAIYEMEDLNHVYKLTIPFVPLRLFDLPEVETTCRCDDRFLDSTINFGFGNLDFTKCTVDKLYIVETIRDKKQKMTIEEIEKALGHGVEIVSSK